MDRRDWLAQLLTDDDVETLKHLAREGMGENGLRALASDLVYLPTWADAATGPPLSWPATEALALKFVAHHLRDPSKRMSDPRHGMPADVARKPAGERLLRYDGPHARTPSSGDWRAGARCTGGKGSRDRSQRRVCARRLRLAVCASPRPRQRNSKRAVTRDILDQLIETCATDRLTDTPDFAILLLAFASGRRRRSDAARLCVEQLRMSRRRGSIRAI